MTQSDLILLARAVANESEVRGFTHTADAMMELIDSFLLNQTHDFSTHPPAENFKSGEKQV